MSIEILDGAGQGYRAQITPDNQLKALAEVQTLQHYYSRTRGQAYQTVGDYTFTGTGTFNLLHIKNTSTELLNVATYIRIQVIDNASLPVATSYFQIGFGMTYASGGTAVTPVNMSRRSGNSASLTAYDNNPTLTGTFVEFDRFYPQGNGDWLTYNKEGSLVLGLNDSVTVRYTTSGTAGIAYARMTSLFMTEAG